MGRVEPDALKILRTDHERFAAAVRDAVKTWRFRPATIAGRPVRQLVQLSFTFTPPR